MPFPNKVCVWHCVFSRMQSPEYQGFGQSGPKYLRPKSGTRAASQRHIERSYINPARCLSVSYI
ncbi:hypothetical protein CY34DRAFT_320425 [Suillus luteus UH-Slu-Lm8-n1]|uniref:Uncharacterized protein n=1 Tax=Suillus luteus UH-Slu-Lm8-n1 TaxID=930992 RepID=A0A0D0AD89_9AGAM|nr:hypothetical protein CY34DRAFT_320425 [Suillus luteus UH-Slu-Lm8-n1]